MQKENVIKKTINYKNLKKVAYNIEWNLIMLI